MKYKIITFLVILTSLFSCNKNELIKTVKPDFFIKGVANAIHSIAFDSKGFMYIGSLGSSSTSPVRKYGTKEIFKIDPKGNIEVYDTVECQYISYLTIDSQDNLYVTLQTNNIFQIMKINTKKERYIYPFTEYGSLKVHHDRNNNIYFSIRNRLYKLNKNDSLTLYSEIIDINFENNGQIQENVTIDKDLVYVYTYKKSYVKKQRILKNGKTSKPIVLIDNLIGTKLILLDNERNTIYILQYDTQDVIIQIKSNGEKIKYNLDLSDFLEHDKKFYHMNDMNFGSSYFQKDFLYIVTWDGDILRVKLEI